MYRNDYDNCYFNFWLGEEISFNEMKWLAYTINSPHKPPELTKEEILLCKYCEAILFASLNLRNNHQSIYKLNNDPKKTAIIETFIYMLNLEAINKFDSKEQKVLIIQQGIFGHVVGNRYPEIIEFVLLQAGWKSESEQLLTPGYHKMQRCQPVSLRKLTDSIKSKAKSSQKENEAFDGTEKK